MESRGSLRAAGERVTFELDPKGTEFCCSRGGGKGSPGRSQGGRKGWRTDRAGSDQAEIWADESQGGGSSGPGGHGGLDGEEFGGVCRLPNW